MEKEVKAKKQTSKYKDLNNPEPMDLKAFGEYMRKSSQRHLHIIADYAEQKKSSFTTKGQWTAFMHRNLAAARRLAPYTQDQIEKAYKGMVKNYLKRDPESHWTLETISKYLDD